MIIGYHTTGSVTLCVAYRPSVASERLQCWQLSGKRDNDNGVVSLACCATMRLLNVTSTAKVSAAYIGGHGGRRRAGFAVDGHRMNGVVDQRSQVPEVQLQTNPWASGEWMVGIII